MRVAVAGRRVMLASASSVLGQGDDYRGDFLLALALRHLGQQAVHAAAIPACERGRVTRCGEGDVTRGPLRGLPPGCLYSRDANLFRHALRGRYKLFIAHVNFSTGAYGSLGPVVRASLRNNFD